MIPAPDTIAPVSKPAYSNYFVEKSRRLFRGEAKDWAYEIQRMTAFIHQFKRGNKVLEIGCGVGTVLFALAREGLDCYGVDFDPVQIENAEALGRELGIEDVTFRCARTEEAPFDPGSFDIVISRDVAEHLPDDDLLAYLQQACEVLKEGGILVLHTKPTKYAYLHEREYVWLLFPVAYFGSRVRKAWLKLLDIVAPRIYRAVTGQAMRNTWQQKPPGHCNCHEKETLSFMVERAGFAIEAIEMFVPANRRYFQVLTKILPFETTKTNILLVARKVSRRAEKQA